MDPRLVYCLQNSIHHLHHEPLALPLLSLGLLFPAALTHIRWHTLTSAMQHTLTHFSHITHRESDISLAFAS
jgi:hypothetical protein